MKLPTLGVFNCDHAVTRPIKEKGKKHRFRFKNGTGTSLLMSIIFVIERKRNVMFTYTPEEFEQIKIDEKGENSIVGLTRDGKVALALPVDLKVLDWENETLDFTMRVLDKVDGPDDLRKLLNPES